MEVKQTTLCGTRWDTIHYDVPKPKEFVEGRRSFHEMHVDSVGNVAAIGRTCCTYRQYGCAYLGSCTAEKPPDIPLGHITDYPVIQKTVDYSEFE